MPAVGWDSVTVPGAVSQWVALSKRFGVLPFADLMEPAIRYARDGFAVSPVIARQWREFCVGPMIDQPGFREAFMPGGRTPVAGERWRYADQAATLEAIARTEGEAFYRGSIAQSIARFARQSGGVMTEDDLAAHACNWVQPIGKDFGGYTVHEIPPNGQGISALMALGMLEALGVSRTEPDTAERWHLQIEAMRLAFADAYAHVADPAHMQVDAAQLLDPSYLASRAALIDPHRAQRYAAGNPIRGGTVYLAAADAQGNMVSLIQSNFRGFGSGVVVPGTGISLQNRGWAFSLQPGHPNEVGPGKRPFHTIIPAFMTRQGAPVMAFGVMGANMQPQGHLQVAMRYITDGWNPQASADAPRFRINDAGDLMVEAATPAAVIEGLRERGHEVYIQPPDSMDFGSCQAIARLSDDLEEGYVAGSETRRDGQAVGF
jgi:gamma-glutamyltranspeptidase/glutathione hydrolase